MIDIGVDYIQLSWHYWLGLGSAMIANLFIFTNTRLHYYSKWLYFVLPLIFSIIIYALGSILSAYVG